jgi:hypothetical protein
MSAKMKDRGRGISAKTTPGLAGTFQIRHHATTSAALKLLRRRLIGRRPGRSDLVPGTTTAAALCVIQSDACAALTMAAIAAGLSCTEVVDWWFPRRVGASVGSREGTGDGGGRGCLVVAVVVAAVPRVAVPGANLGILFGDWPFADRSVRVVVVVVVLVDATPTAAFLFVAAAVERVTRIGLCSEVVTREPIARVADAGFGRVRLAGGATPRAGRTSASSVSSSESSTAIELRFGAGVFRG